MPWPSTAGARSPAVLAAFGPLGGLTSIAAVVLGHPRTGMLGVVERVLHELADVLVLDPVEDLGALLAGAHQPGAGPGCNLAPGGGSVGERGCGAAGSPADRDRGY